mmetsp:Transcript_13456/g.29798  ORF Transcript_13456/g.29798 Transcript_13456/m.29798 type:complete len:361 (-) Transcript_13456:555-1637(-)
MPRSPASKPSPVLLGSPPKPKALAAQHRAASIITPQSSTLLNARVVSIAPDGTETDLRPLLASDVLCGRGGLVNGYIGNVEYRDLVSTKRGEYLAARKRDKAEVSRAIVQAVLSKGGLFLRRADDKNGKGGKEAAAGISSDTGDARGSKWIDIGEGKAREKTSQALREGLEVRKQTSTGAAGVVGGFVAAVTKKRRSRTTKTTNPTIASYSAFSAPPGARNGEIQLLSFLPLPVVNYLQFQSSMYDVIGTPEKFEESVSSEAGKQLLARRLFEWNGVVSAAGHDRSTDWIASLGTVELWRRQVDIWCDCLANLRTASENDDNDSPPPSPKKRKAAAAPPADDDTTAVYAAPPADDNTMAV